MVWEGRSALAVPHLERMHLAAGFGGAVVGRGRASPPRDSGPRPVRDGRRCASWRIGSTTLSGISDRFYLAVQQPRRSTGVPAALLQLQGRLRGSGRATLPCISARIVSVPLKQEHRLDGLIAAIAIRSRELGREFNERAERRRLTEGAIDVEDLQQQADTLAAELRQQETERTERARARDNRPARCPDCNRVCCNCNEREPEPS